MIKWAKPYATRFWLGAAALLFTNLLGYWVPLLLKRAIDGLRSGLDAGALGRIAALIFVAAVTQAAIRISSRLLIFNAARDVERNMREALFAHLLTIAPERLQGFSTGDLQSRLTNDLQNVRLLFGAGLLNVVNAAIAYTCALPLMLAQSPLLTLVALLPYPGLIYVMRKLARRVFTQSTAVQERLGTLSNLVSEDLNARLFITASGLGPLEERRFAEKNDAYLEANLVLVRTRALMVPIMTVIGSFGIAVSLLVGGQLVIREQLTLGSLVAFMSYLTLLAWPTMMLGFMLAMWQRGRASYARVEKVFAEPSWVSGASLDAPPGALPLAAHTPALPAAGRPGHIHLHGLTVRRGGATVLNDVSLDVPHGGFIGVVGEVGSGKTTLMLALARLLDVPPESYFFEGQDVTALPLDAVRRRIGFVPQQPFLFSLSMRDNIAFGRKEVSDEEVARVLQYADFNKDLHGFTGGLETLIGERGVMLSGGQKQRLALARALVCEPELLLLDDCFSAVDAETEQRIIEGLHAYRRERTMIIATHRLAVLEHTDKIFVLSEGRIVEAGTQAELLAAGKLFSELYRRQRLREKLEPAAPLPVSEVPA